MTQFKRSGRFGNNKNLERPQFGGSNSRPGGFNRDRRPAQMFKATCSTCGKPCEVPFRPTNDRPVFCRECFRTKGVSRDKFDRRPTQASAPFPEKPREFRPRTDDTQFIALNKKLDMIVEKLDALIHPLHAIAAVEQAPVPAEIIPEKKPKIKKKSRKN